MSTSDASTEEKIRLVFVYQPCVFGRTGDAIPKFVEILKEIGQG
jgi:hypothetical protein